MSENNGMDRNDLENMEDMEEDLVVFETEDGEEVTFRVEDYFFYNGDEYAILTECVEDEEAEEDEDEEAGLEVIVCRVETGTDENGEETEEFVNIEDEDLANKLIEIANTQMMEDEEDEEN